MHVHTSMYTESFSLWLNNVRLDNNLCSYHGIICNFHHFAHFVVFCVVSTSDPTVWVLSSPGPLQFIVECHGNTLLPQFLGMYRLTVDGVETYMVVTRNVFSHRLTVHRKYDLKVGLYTFTTQQMCGHHAAKCEYKLEAVVTAEEMLNFLCYHHL